MELMPSHAIVFQFQSCFSDFPLKKVNLVSLVKYDDYKDQWISKLFIHFIVFYRCRVVTGMAYATLATLPPICGLYTSLFAPLIYFFLGSSKHASMGWSVLIIYLYIYIHIYIYQVLHMDLKLNTAACLHGQNPKEVMARECLLLGG